jgi:hypothetical protein
MRRRALCLVLLLAGAVTAGAQAPDAPRKLTLHPTAAPTPALKYVLLPELADMKPGNAALHYQRAHSFEWWSNVRRLPYYHEIGDWLDRPLQEVRDKIGFVRHFEALKAVDAGARRESCDWEMTERLRKEGIGMLLPDVQGFREYAILLAMRCRLEIADKDYADALHTLQTGLALGRHVSDMPTLISALVGNASCALMLGRVEELIQAPGSPNLYWALTDLPRPLLDLRKALQGEKLITDAEFRRRHHQPTFHMQGEKLLIDAEFPDLKTLETERLSPQAQQRALKKLALLGALSGSDAGASGDRTFGLLPLALKAYPAAKRALIAQGRKAEDVAALPVIQVILIDALQQYYRLRDDALKWANVPYPQARPHWVKLREEIRATAREHPGATPLLTFVPHIQRVHEATLQLDRRVAALRCVEALRLYAAAHGGKLPAKLSDITEVPVPDDPVTGKGFVYQVDGDRVTLRDPPLADGQPALFEPLHYELTFKR